MAPQRGFHLHPLAERHLKLKRHQVHAGHELRDGMLHLEARVHLQEVEVAVVVHQELDRPCVRVAGLLGQSQRGFPDPGAEIGVDHRGRRLLDQFLVPPLQRAVAFGQERKGAPRVREHLGLDVVRPFEIPLQIHLGAAEVGARFAGRALQRFLKFLARLHDAHALAAAPERRLHREGEPDPLRLGPHVVERHGAGSARHHRDAGALGGPAGRHLVAHHGDGVGGWPHERQAGVVHGPGEVRVLGQEPVSGMDQGGAGLLGRGEQRPDVEVGLSRGRRPDSVGLVRQLDVQGVAVGVGVHRDGGHAELAAGPDDTDRDLPAVGDQDSRCGHCAPLRGR